MKVWAGSGVLVVDGLKRSVVNEALAESRVARSSCLVLEILMLAAATTKAL